MLNVEAVIESEAEVEKYNKKCNLLLLKILIVVTELQKHFLHFYVERASASTKFIKGHFPYHKRKTRNKAWFSQSCKELHSIVKKYAQLVNTFPVDGTEKNSMHINKNLEGYALLRVV